LKNPGKWHLNAPGKNVCINPEYREHIMYPPPVVHLFIPGLHSYSVIIHPFYTRTSRVEDGSRSFWKNFLV
jgi:hypothetical protein